MALYAIKPWIYRQKLGLKLGVCRFGMVDARGFEPLTSSVSGKRSKPTELSVQKNALHHARRNNIATIANQINNYFKKTILFV